MSDTINEAGVQPGMVCTYGCYTDRHGAIVVSVTKKTFSIKKLYRGRNKVQWPAQDWEVEDAKETDPVFIVRQNKHGGFQRGLDRYSTPRFLDKKDWGRLFYEDPSF